MSAEMTDEVMRRLAAHDGLLAKQDRVLAAQTEEMARMFQMLSALTSNVDTVTVKAVRPPSDSDMEISHLHDHDDPRFLGHDNACASPDRKSRKKKLILMTRTADKRNNGLPDELHGVLAYSPPRLTTNLSPSTPNTSYSQYMSIEVLLDSPTSPTTTVPFTLHQPSQSSPPVRRHVPESSTIPPTWHR
jgi:hypothetical protein